MDRVNRPILDKAPLTAWWRQTGPILAQLRGHGARLPRLITCFYTSFADCSPEHGGAVSFLGSFCQNCNNECILTMYKSAVAQDMGIARLILLDRPRIGPSALDWLMNLR